MVPITVTLFFVLAAAIITVWHAATGKPVLWISVLLLCVVEMLQVLPK